MSMSENKVRICVCIGVEAPEEAVVLLKEESAADVLEIRLDWLRKKDPELFFGITDTELLFTNRPVWEGGFFNGAEHERIELLVRAIEGGASYVDCEYRAPLASRERLRAVTRLNGAQLICSWHDFTSTPSAEQLRETLLGMHGSGADIGKIVTTARDHLDVLRVLGLQEVAASLDFPLIAFCMGVPGMISRLVTIQLGGYMTYCAPDQGRETAAGQLSAADIRVLSARFP